MLNNLKNAQEFKNVQGSKNAKKSQKTSKNLNTLIICVQQFEFYSRILNTIKEIEINWVI